jgi:hypothetical protein
MANRRTSLLVAALLCGVLAGCNLAGNAVEGPNRSAEEVLASAQAAAELTRQATYQTPPPTAAPPTGTAPPGTPTPTATNTPAPPEVNLSAKYNVYIRSGPGEEFGHVGFFLKSQEGIAVARFEHLISGTWWLIRIPAAGGLEGWVWDGAVDLLGDGSGVPVVENP